MLTLLTEKLPELERLCKLHGVKRLEVVGSAAREVDFDPTPRTWTSSSSSSRGACRQRLAPSSGFAKRSREPSAGRSIS
jgi:hypothetical protein